MIQNRFANDIGKQRWKKFQEALSNFFDYFFRNIFVQKIEEENFQNRKYFHSIFLVFFITRLLDGEENVCLFFTRANFRQISSLHVETGKLFAFFE